MTPFSGYQKRLLVFLSVATFFEGYDFLALSQILPNLRSELSLSESAGGNLVACINLGTVVAMLLVRRADRWGRKRVLTLTIAGYTLCTFLTGFAPNVYFFALFQFFARLFLIGEWALSMVYAAEEFPEDRRGTVIGMIQTACSLGSILCAGLVPLLLKSPWGWRSVYFVGILPLLLLAWARRDIQESSRFQQKNLPDSLPFTRILHSPYRNRMLQLALIWALTYACTQNAITFWKEFALEDRHWDDAMVGKAISIAAVGALPLVALAGRGLDLLGRRVGATLIFLLTVLGVGAAYQLEGFWPLTLSLLLGIAGTNAVLPVLNTYTTELFPTELRSDAFAWANNLLGRISYVLAPIGVGMAAERVGWGQAVVSTTVFPLIALALLLLWLPETSNRSLEETSAV